MAKTTTQFLDAVKRRVSIPSQQALLDDADIMALGDECLKAFIVPMLISIRQDYFVYVVDIPLVVGQAEYDIPYRATGRSLRDLKVVDNSQTIVRNIVKIDLEDAHLYNNERSSVRPYGFHFQGDKIKLLPAAQSSDLSLRVFFELPPNDLVAVSAAAKVEGLSGDIITVDSVPSTFSTSTETDFIAGKQGNFTRSFDKTPTATTSNTITYATADIPSTLVVGDYIALAQQSPVLQIPDDCYPWLVTKTSRRVLYAISDFEGYDRLEKDDKEEEKRLKIVLEPRTRGEPTKIVNRFSVARQGRFSYGRGVIF